jgi:putative protease
VTRVKIEELLKLIKSPKTTDVKPRISLKINSEHDLKHIDLSKIGRIYVPINLVNSLEAVNDTIERYLYVPNVVSEDMYEYLKENIKSYENIFDGVCVNNIGTYSFFEKHSKLKIHCGYFFNIINSYNAKALQERGAEGISFSIEANTNDIEAISENTSLKTELVSYAYIQMMTMKNCPFSALKSCKSQGNCNACEYREGYQLKDRLGINFNIEREDKISKLYNSVPLTTIGRTSDFLDYNIDYYFVDSKWVEDINSVIDVLYKELNEEYVDNNEYDILKSNSFTRGHYFKNVL